MNSHIHLDPANEPDPSLVRQGAGTIERVIRKQLKVPGSRVQEAAGWEASAVSRVLSGQQGVPLAKLDAVVSAAGYVLVSRRYLEAIGTLSEVGMFCHCARSGSGECGMERP